MAEKALPKVYHYNAQGHGLSARFDRPIQDLIEVQAASSLPTTGGHGSSRVTDFELGEFVSFKEAHSHVSGSRKDGNAPYTTLATVTVEELNILDVVTADRIVVRLASEHPENEDEPHIIALGSKFENLQIGGYPVDVELDHGFFLPLDTFEAIRKELASNASFRRIAKDPYKTGQTQKVPPDPQGVFLCSLVKDIKTASPGVKREGHVLVIPQFGKVFLAEMLCKHGRRTLTMLRVEMGSPVSGTAVATEADVNGTTWPP